MKSGQANPIGIMQGRLTPPVAFRLQAFPTGAWEAEFERAKTCGLDSIEWLFEADDGRGHSYLENPLWSQSGRDKICRVIDQTGIPVTTCCADYFMPHPFFRVSEAERLESAAVLKQLILNVAQIGARSILVPVLEISAIRTPEEKDLLLKSLKEPLDLAAEKGIVLGLETELPAQQYLALVEDAHNPALGVYYDTGNNAAQGHDIAADARILGPYLVGVHVKDRKRGGSTVLLGQGDADFRGFFKETKAAGYTGPVILQAAFRPDFMGIAARHRQFIEDCLK